MRSNSKDSSSHETYLNITAWGGIFGPDKILENPSQALQCIRGSAMHVAVVEERQEASGIGTHEIFNCLIGRYNKAFWLNNFLNCNSLSYLEFL